MRDPAQIHRRSLASVRGSNRSTVCLDAADTQRATDGSPDLGDLLGNALGGGNGKGGGIGDVLGSILGGR